MPPPSATVLEERQNAVIRVMETQRELVRRLLQEGVHPEEAPRSTLARGTSSGCSILFAAIGLIAPPPWPLPDRA